LVGEFGVRAEVIILLLARVLKWPVVPSGSGLKLRDWKRKFHISEPWELFQVQLNFFYQESCSPVPDYSWDFLSAAACPGSARISIRWFDLHLHVDY
jgi:hypothetical protein